MSGGGKSQTSTQQVQIPPEVMARYNAVNTRAEATASKPFQQYSQDPNAFVAPLTATQQAGIQNVNQAANMAQPYFQNASELTMAGSQGVGPLTHQQIQYYQNPFTQSVVNSTMAGLQQQQGQAQSQQQAEAIKGGAFGGDRAGIQRAQLMGQQGLATAQAISPLYQRGYEQALQAAQGQQGVRAQDLQRQLVAGQQLGGLGTAAQQAAISGGQAQIGAGTAEQQTQQAGLQALYNQFLQERGYDFQTAQFLANIAMGTGALSGSTTSTTQQAPFFSDEREKTNVQPLGEGMYAYDYIDDVRRAEDEGRPMPPKRVGPMAQDIEERAPGLVGEVGGHKVVDASGGLGRMGYQSMGGMVSGPGAYATGGSVVGSDDMRAILAAIGQPLEFYGGKGLYGGAAKGGAGSPGYVPQGQIATPKLVTAGGLPQQQPSGLAQAAATGEKLAGLAKMGQSALVGSEGVGGKKGSRGLIGSEGSISNKGYISGLGGGSSPSANAGVGAPVSLASAPPADIEGVRDVAMDTDQLGSLFAARGGLMRHHYDLGGSLPYATDEQGKDPLQDIGEDDNQKYEMLKPTPPPSGSGGGSALGDIANIAKTAASIFAMSDERMKDNVEPVGELYDGQPIYRYNMKGSPQTQLGLMAQDVERNGHSDAVAGLGGVKMVDYKRATDVAAGLAGRHNYQEGGNVRSSPDLDQLAALMATMGKGTNQFALKHRFDDGLETRGQAAFSGPASQYGAGLGFDLGGGRLDLDALYGSAPNARPQMSGKVGYSKRFAEGGFAGRRGYATEGFVEEDLPMLLAALQERAPEERRAPGLGPVTMSDADPVPLISSREPEMERKPEMEREPGLVIAQARTPDQPGVAPVRSDEPPAGGVVPAPRVATPASTVVAPPTPPARPEEVGDLSPQALRAYTAERARALGIDPNFATAVFQGESGFRANARGDEGSSFNVAQLHYGNVSDRYPRSGLGDVFTRETGLDARDPANARAVIDWSLKHAAQNGWNAWTVARNLKAQGAAGGSGAPAPGVAGGERPSRMSDSSSGIMDTVTSEGFLVPALAGLGAMLSSKSPYLLGAVGEGLVGGTGAYTSLQKQSADILKQRFDIARNVFRGPVMNKNGEFVWEDTRTGEMLTQSEYQRRYNAFLTGRSGTVEPRPGADAVRVANEASKPAAALQSPSVAQQPAAAQSGDETPAAAQPAAAQPAAAQPAAAQPAAAQPAAAQPAATSAPNVAQMRQQALENQDLWKNTDPAMNPRVLLPQVNNLDTQIKDLEKRADEASKLATTASERNPQQGTIYQNQATNLYAQATKLREEMREKLARANQSLDAAVQLDVEAAKTRQAATISRDFANEIGPDGTKISLAPGTSLPARAAPQPTQDQLAAPKKADVDPATGNLVLARPQAPAGGGLILPDLPPGAKITELSPVAKNQIEVDGQFQKDFMEKAPSIGQARQRYMGLVNAFKSFESGSTASVRAGWAAVAETFGYPDIARSIINGEPAGVQWVDKIGPNLVLETLKAATPRFAQSEFLTLQDKGTPEPNKLPQTNFQMVKEGLATLNRSEAFIRAWDRASREEGWRSPSAYYSAWGQANPLSKFEEAAEMQMGNFKGMPLPPSDKWVPGAIYTVPSNLPVGQRDALARYGLKAGEPFQYLGRNAPADQRIRRLETRQLFSVPAMGQ
jgi:hypothetical protein